MVLICAYASTFTVDDDKKDDFYEDLDRVLRVANSRDKIVLLGVFKAIVGRRSDLWTNNSTILSEMNVGIRHVAPRRNQCSRKKTNCAVFRDDSQQRKYQEEVRALLRGNF